MLWIALHMPWLSLEAALAALAASDSEAARAPVALVEGQQVLACNAAAAACGIRPGGRRATAQALSAQLLLVQACPLRDAQALQAVAHAALAFTPAVTLEGPCTVLLEVQASLRLFGGAQALCRRLLQALAPLGHRVQWAAAPTALGAALLARMGLPPGDALGPQATDPTALQALLDPAPAHWLAAPGSPPAELARLQEGLQAMGLQTLGALRRQPRSGIARRFGTALLERLDRATGRRPDPRCWVEAPEHFEARLELQARAELSAQLLPAAALLLAQLLAWAQARHGRVAAFTLQMAHEPRHREGETVPPFTALHLALAEPALDAAHLQTLLRERLERLVLPAPSLQLCLQCRHLVQAAAPQGDLFPGAAGSHSGLARLLERLRARLGDEQVLSLQPVQDHRPECASRLQPLQGLPAGQAALPAAGQPPALPLHRPAWLLPRPLPLAEREGLPWFQGRPLQLLSGPERIETGWWDGAAVARDYFTAQAADGALVWIWRGRLQQGEAAGWFLQGLFA